MQDLLEDLVLLWWEAGVALDITNPRLACACRVTRHPVEQHISGLMLCVACGHTMQSLRKEQHQPSMMIVTP